MQFNYLITVNVTGGNEEDCVTYINSGKVLSKGRVPRDMFSLIVWLLGGTCVLTGYKTFATKFSLA